MNLQFCYGLGLGVALTAALFVAAPVARFSLVNGTITSAAAASDGSLRDPLVSPASCPHEPVPYRRDPLCPDMREGTAALVAEVARRRAAALPFSLSALEGVHDCLRRHSGVPQVAVERDVLFLVMGGSAKLDRAEALRATWARNFSSNVVVVGDIAAPKVGMITFPEIAGKADYTAAQARQMHALKHVILGPEAATYARFKWFALVDDDSWINVRQIASFLFGWAPDAPLLFGFIWDHPPWNIVSTWPSGPFMLLSRAAAERMAPEFFTGACPMSTPPLNDMTMGMCAWATGVPLVHTPLADPEGFRVRTNNPVGELASNAELLSMLSIHRVSPGVMHALQARATAAAGL